MSDVFLYQTTDDGDVKLVNGDLLVDGGIQTAVYLSLFGGNNDDGGFDDKTYMWWANFAEVDTVLQYRSETQFLLQSEPLTSASLLRIEDAVKRDLQWLIDKGEATSIEAEASVPTVDRLQLDIDIDDVKLIYVENLNG